MEYKFIAHAFKKLDIKIRNIKIDKKRLWNWKKEINQNFAIKRVYLIF